LPAKVIGLAFLCRCGGALRVPGVYGAIPLAAADGLERPSLALGRAHRPGDATHRNARHEQGPPSKGAAFPSWSQAAAKTGRLPSETYVPRTPPATFSRSWRGDCTVKHVAVSDVSNTILAAPGGRVGLRVDRKRTASCRRRKVPWASGSSPANGDPVIPEIPSEIMVETGWLACIGP